MQNNDLKMVRSFSGNERSHSNEGPNVALGKFDSSGSNERLWQMFTNAKVRKQKSEDLKNLTLSRRRPLSYRNQSIDLRSKPMYWFLYDKGLRLERVKILFRVVEENFT